MQEHLIKIRQAEPNDFEKLANIWLETSIEAHDFIPKSYWVNNKSAMQNHYLPMSEVYLIEEAGQVCAFIALVENKVAAIFVSPGKQGKGLGKLLISHAKKLRKELELNVYQENENSVAFYKANGFRILKESLDTETQAKEFVMLWENSI